MWAVKSGLVVVGLSVWFMAVRVIIGPDPTPPKPPAPTIWSDPATGCQYLIVSGGITLRRSPDGYPVCSPAYESLGRE